MGNHNQSLVLLKNFHLSHGTHWQQIYVMQPGSGEDPKLQSTPKMPPTKEAGLPTESS